MHTRSGFTFLELAMVLIIIGLVAGGVVAGRSMLSNSESRVIMSEMATYTTAYQEFVDRYQAIPGDMNNATTVWGAAAGCPSVDPSTEVQIATCDGDGDGRIGDWKNASYSTYYEWFFAWQHLANSEFIEGRFNGAPGPANVTQAIPGVNVPASRSGKGGWSLLWMSSTINDAYGFAASAFSGHVLTYGAPTATYITDGVIISPIQAHSIDEKMDDAKPYKGTVRTKSIDYTTCATAYSADASYQLTSEAQGCQLIFLTGA